MAPILQIRGLRPATGWYFFDVWALYSIPFLHHLLTVTSGRCLFRSQFSSSVKLFLIPNSEDCCKIKMEIGAWANLAQEEMPASDLICTQEWLSSCISFSEKVFHKYSQNEWLKEASERVNGLKIH